MSTAAVRYIELAYELLNSSVVDGGNDESAEQGSGERPSAPFVWGHGLTSSRSDEDRFPYLDTRMLAADRTVLRYDTVGHGDSSPLPAADRGSWAELAADQIALIDHVGFDEVIIGGASMGAGTALHTAAMIGDRVKALVLAIPPTGWDSRQAQVGMYEQMAGIIDAKGVEPLIASSATLPPPDPFVGSNDYRQRAAARMRAADPMRLAANFRGAFHAQLPAPTVIARIEAPTLVLAWSGDPGHPVSTAERLGELLSSCEVVISSTADDLATWTDRAAAFIISL